MGEQLFLRRLESTLPVISIWVSMMCNLIRNLAILLKEVFIPYSLSLLLPCSHILFHSTTFSSLSFTTIGSRAHLFTGFFLPSGASFGPSPFTEIPTSFKRLCACRPARWDLMLWNSWSIWRLAVFSVWRNTRGIFGGIVTYPTKERFQETQVIEKGLFFFSSYLRTQNSWKNIKAFTNNIGDSRRFTMVCFSGFVDSKICHEKKFCSKGTGCLIGILMMVY